MGRVLPNDLEQLTLDQFLITWLSNEELGAGKTSFTPEEAAEKGLDVEVGGKTGVQIALEKAAKKRRAEARAARIAKRAARKEVANG